MESESVSTKQRRIAELARIHPEVSFTSLAYHIDLRWLHELTNVPVKTGRLEWMDRPPRNMPRI